MKLVRPIDFVFLIGLGIFAGSCLITKFAGGVGPCGPASDWVMLWLIGYPFGAIGMVVGSYCPLSRPSESPDQKNIPTPPQNE